MQAHLLQLQRKQVTVKYSFFSFFGDFPTQEIKKKKKRKETFWVATFLVSGDIHNNQAAFIISARIQMI